MAANKTYQFKLVMIGDNSKRHIVERFVFGTFTANGSVRERSTIGAAFLTQTVSVQDCVVRFEIWDTAGQERYHSLASMYYRGAAAAMVVYDITDKHSFGRAKSWVKELQEQSSPDTVIAFVGNKVDREEERAVATADAKQYADKNSLYFIETSAKTNVNIRELFLAIARKLPKENNNDEEINGFIFDEDVIEENNQSNKVGVLNWDFNLFKRKKKKSKSANDEKKQDTELNIDNDIMDDTGENEELKKQVKQLQNEITTLLNEHKEHQKNQIEILLYEQKENKQLKVENETLQKKLNKFQNQITLLIDEQKEMQFTIDNLKEENNKLKLTLKRRHTDFKEWDYNDVIEWIFSIENGLFQKHYENDLHREITENQLSGNDLVQLTTNDMKGFGIKLFKHKKLLEQHIQKLLNQNNNANQNNNENQNNHVVYENEGAQTPYI
eukprot:370335_1